MKLEDQVCSLELAKRLKELGVKQESLFYHLYGGICYRSECLPLAGIDWCSAFTVAELGEILPLNFTSIRKNANDENKIVWMSAGIENIITKMDTYSDKEADARAKMIIYLIENKLTEV